MSADRRLLAALVVAVLLGVPSGAAARDVSVDRAAAYLARAQNPDGGYGGTPGASSSSLFSAWASIGLAAAGLPRDHGVAGFLAAQDGVTRTGDVERTILGLRAQGAPVPAALEQRLLAAQAPDGGFEKLVNLTTFAVLALRAAGHGPADPAVARAGRWLVARQHADGGFSFAGAGGAASADDTGAAIQALAAAGRSPRGAVVRRAVAWLLGRQNRDGGWASLGGTSNAQSTAFAIQGLVAAGRDPGKRAKGRSRSALGFLRSLQGADGAVRYSRTSRQTPVWVTAQALAALARRPLPVAPPPA